MYKSVLINSNTNKLVDELLNILINFWHKHLLSYNKYLLTFDTDHLSLFHYFTSIGGVAKCNCLPERWQNLIKTTEKQHKKTQQGDTKLKGNKKLLIAGANAY